MTVRILDGSLADLLRGFPRAGLEAGPSIAALDERELVTRLHREFLTAGADIVRTATVALGRWRCNMEGLAGRFAEANERAASAAVAARDAVNPGALVAGTIGPLRARYEPDLLPPAPVIETETLEQVLVLAPHVDLFLLETLSTGAEAAAMVRAAASTNRPVWVSFTFHEGGPLLTRGGETPAQALAPLEGLPVAAVLANCTTAEVVGEAVSAFARLRPDIPVGGYGDGFEVVRTPYCDTDVAEAIGGRIAMTAAGYARFARGWIESGARIVGGCCGTGPGHIAALRKLVSEAR